MNKNFYRLIFSKACGMLIAVAEFARSHRAGSVSSPVREYGTKIVLRYSAISFGLLLATGAVQIAHAEIVADAGAAAGMRPTVINGGNPYAPVQVDIQTPSAAGVSRNVYSQFDVNKKGVILNNSQGLTTVDVSGYGSYRYIKGNASLAQGSAKIILNEVNSRNPSQLNGIIWVAGNKAQVIIANPSGITCDGCEFKNTSRATLTTGQAQIDNGILSGYRVEKGEVVIKGEGMTTSMTDYTDIIARSVKMQSTLAANDLKVTIGRNKVDAANKQITALNDAAGSSPSLALDVSSLGGMYAGAITLVSTEKGVGINNKGMIGESVHLTQGLGEDVMISVNGDIDNSGTITKREGKVYIDVKNIVNSGEISSSTYFSGYTKDVIIKAENIENKGSIYSEEFINLAAQGEVKTSGKIESVDGAITIAAGEFKSSATSVISAGGERRSKAHGDIDITSSGDINVNGIVHSKRGAVNLNAKGDVINAGNIAGNLYTHIAANNVSNSKNINAGYGGVEIKTVGVVNNSGEIASAGGVTINDVSGW